MKGYIGERLLVQFYFAVLNAQQSFERLYWTLLRLGAKPTGHIDLIDPELPRHVITKPLRYFQENVYLTLGEIDKLLQSPPIRIVELGITNAVGLTTEPDEYEGMSYQFISPEAAQVDHNPITITTQGSTLQAYWLFDDEETRVEALQTGLKSYARFIELCRESKPSYATMNVESHYLECPYDLQQTSEQGIWREFYISRSYLGEARMEQLKSICEGAYFEDLPDGVYVSHTELWNPVRLNCERDVDWGKEIAQLIASVSKNIR